MLNFCTLFNSNYFSRGLACYESLKENCEDFHLYIFAFDDTTYYKLLELGLEKITPISLLEFENEELLKIKATRSAVEYCWTCTPSTVLYILKKFDVRNCTYIDADLIFYKDPSVLLENMGSKSVLITPHRYAEKYKYFEAQSGIFCVQFVFFKNDKAGLEVLNWWVTACLEWCFARFEEGKFGDQKYLDDWPLRFSCVKVCNNSGAGVAPWNQLDYEFEERKSCGLFYLKTRQETDLIFFHFHGIKFYSNGFVDLSETYPIKKDFIEKIYNPYLEKLLMMENHYLNSPGFNPHGSKEYKNFVKFQLKRLKRKLNGHNNIIRLKTN